MSNLSKDVNYVLTLFTLKGQESWRVHLGGPAAFDKHVENERKQGHPYHITGIQIFHIDRITGGITKQH